MKKKVSLFLLTIILVNMMNVFYVSADILPVTDQSQEESFYELPEEFSMVKPRVVISPSEIETLTSILPKEIITIAGTTVATTGAVISTPVLIGVCIVMATLGVGFTAYNFWKYYNAMHPKENIDGTVTFRPSLNNTMKGEVVTRGGIKWYKQSIYFDRKQYPQFNSDEWMSLGTFPMPYTWDGSVGQTSQTLMMFAVNKYYDSSTGEWKEFYADQDSYSMQNVLVSINPSMQTSFGTINNNADTTSAERYYIDSYLSVWKPQEPLYKLVGLKRFKNSSGYVRRIRLAKDHWSSLQNALSGTFNNVSSANVTSPNDDFNTYTIYMRQPSVGGLTAPQYYGIDLYTKLDYTDEETILIPDNVKPNQDFIVKVPTVEEWAEEENPLAPKPEVITPTAPSPDNPFPDLPDTFTPPVEEEPEPDNPIPESGIYIPILSDILKYIKLIWEWTTNFFKTLFDGLKDLLTPIVEPIIKLLLDTFNLLSEWWHYFTDWVTNSWNVFANTIIDYWQTLIKWLKDFGTSFSTAIQNIIDAIGNSIANLGQAIYELFIPQPEDIEPVFNDMQTTFDDKFPIVQQVTDLKEEMQNKQGDDWRLAIPLPVNIFTGNNKSGNDYVVTLPDFFEEEVRPTARLIMVGFVSFMFLMIIIKQIWPKLDITDTGE